MQCVRNAHDRSPTDRPAFLGSNAGSRQQRARSLRSTRCSATTASMWSVALSVRARSEADDLPPLTWSLARASSLLARLAAHPGHDRGDAREGLVGGLLARLDEAAALGEVAEL